MEVVDFEISRMTTFSTNGNVFAKKVKRDMYFSGPNMSQIRSKYII